MNKIWLVAKHQFMKEASKRSFLLVLLILPLFLTVVIGLGFLTAQLDRQSTSLGFVDEAGLITQMLTDAEEYDTELIRFNSRELALASLNEGDIDAFYVIAAGYSESRDAELVFREQPPYQATRLFEDTVRINLMAAQPAPVVNRMLSGAEVTVRTTDSNRLFAGGNPTFSNFLPLLIAAMFAFLVLTTSGYLTEVIVDEKENRTMEVIITSLSPGRMMAGKILGAVGIALAQLTTWILFLIAAIWLGGNILDLSWLQSVKPIWWDILKVAAVAIPTYLCLAALMTIVGSMLVDSQEASQVGGFSMLFLFLPIYFLVPIASNPNGPIAVVLTLIPGTSIVTVAMRSLIAEVPSWQVASSAAIAATAAILLIWVAGKTFRMTMLRYGQRVRIKELFSARRRLSESSASN
jgi:ABC-2 type transport system permease protein